MKSSSTFVEENTMVDEIRLHGQGGQGVVAAGELIAIAASYEGKFCRAFPMYGSARRGAPVLAFAQIGDESEATRSMIYNPGYVIVLDPSMPETTDVTTGMVPGGTVIYNTSKRADEVKKLFKAKLGKLAVVDATSIAQRIIGRPIPNTVILGAFAKTTGLLKEESIEKAIDKRFSPKLASTNKGAAKMGYESVEVKTL
jgi:2-oxoacid:acceptor oxidoreductase gamma subunit (pyruvate/2-ketoisovalerate family)